MRIELKQVLFPQPKSKIKAGDGKSEGKYKFYTSSPIQIKFIDEANYDKPSLIFGTGGNASIHFCDEPFSTSTDCLVMYGRSRIELETIYNYLKSNMEILENGFKGAGLKHISKDYILAIEVDLPSEAIQHEFLQKTHIIDNLIAAKRAQLCLNEDLVKSRFIEMFGGIKDDEKVAMSDICLIITDGTHQPPQFTKTGIPFIFVTNIVGNIISYDAEKFISEETYAELMKRTPLEIGDVLLSTVGSYGHPAVVKSDKPFCFQRHIAYLKPNKELIDSEYLHGAILSIDVQKQIEERVKGIAQKTLNLSEIRKIKLPLPTIDEQKQYAAFVEQVDKSKFYIIQTLRIIYKIIRAIQHKTNEVLL